MISKLRIIWKQTVWQHTLLQIALRGCFLHCHIDQGAVRRVLRPVGLRQPWRHPAAAAPAMVPQPDGTPRICPFCRSYMGKSSNTILLVPDERFQEDVRAPLPPRLRHLQRGLASSIECADQVNSLRNKPCTPEVYIATRQFEARAPASQGPRAPRDRRSPPPGTATWRGSSGPTRSTAASRRLSPAGSSRRASH